MSTYRPRAAGLLSFAVFINAGLAAFADSAAPKAPQFSIRDVKTITPEGDFNAWPTLARRSNGHLIVVWSGGREAHACPFGRLQSMVSRDGGESWSWPRVLLDTEIDDRDGGVLETSKGTLLATTFSGISYARSFVIDRDKDKRTPAQLEKWKRFQNVGPVREVAGKVDRWILRSVDGGLTWSAPLSVTFSSPHGPIQLKDGRQLYPAVEGVPAEHRREFDFMQPGIERKIGVWESRDDGLTWRMLARLPVRGRDNPDFYHEPHGVEASDGTLIVHIRSHVGADGQRDRAVGEILQTVSKDRGASWSEPRATGINGYPSHLLRLRDGRLLMSYGFRRTPYGVHARISADSGASWSEPMILVSYAQSRDMGYPSTVEMPDGSLVTVWYEVTPQSPKAVLQQARWSLSTQR